MRCRLAAADAHRGHVEEDLVLAGGRQGHLAQLHRAGLESVPRGQWEAAVALNLSKYRTYRDIVLPQAIPPIVPALGNYLIGIFKGEAHPYYAAPEHKFNPLQHVTYVGLMYVTYPLLLLSGVALLFPGFLPQGLLGRRVVECMGLDVAE